jgi:tripartite-type tricarboxylate transporter receptor subunit TctC
MFRIAECCIFFGRFARHKNRSSAPDGASARRSAHHWESKMIACLFRRLYFASLLVTAAVAIVIPEAGAQQFPSNTIRIVAGAAGNPGDITSRIIANELAQSEGWRVIVENRPGAMQTIAAAEVLKQPADGHSIFVGALVTAVAPALLANMNFRLDAEFTPVIKLATAHNILVVHPSVPATSLPQFVTCSRVSRTS